MCSIAGKRQISLLKIWMCDVALLSLQNVFLKALFFCLISLKMSDFFSNFAFKSYAYTQMAKLTVQNTPITV